MGLSSCIKKAEQFIKKQRNEAMRKSGKPAADKLLADQTAALESLQAKLGDISSLNADDAAAADAIRSAIEDLFIDRESLEIQIAGRGIEVKAAPFKLEDVVSKQGSTIPSGWTSSQDFNDRDTFEYSPAGRDSNWASVTHIGGAKEKGAFSVRIYEGRNAPATEEIFGTRSSVLMQAKESVDAKNAQPVHIEGGEIERVTPAVVAESLKKSAANTKFNPKEALNWLTSEVKKAIASAPAVAEWKTEDHGFKTFDVPGDGTFKVKNAKENLESFIAKVEASPGFKNVRTPKPQLVADWQKTGKAGSESEVREMLVDGDYTAAYEYSKQIGKPLHFSFNAAKDQKPILITDGRPFEHEGFDDFKFVSGRTWFGGNLTDKWQVISLDSGLIVASGSSRKAAEAKAHASFTDKVTPEKLGEMISDKLKSGEGKTQEALATEWTAWAEKEEGGASLLSDQKAEAAKPELQRDNEKVDAEYRKKWHSTGVGQGGVIHYKREFDFEGKKVEAVMWETAGRYDDGYVTYDGKKVFTARDTVNGAQEQIDRFLDSRYLSQDHEAGTAPLVDPRNNADFKGFKFIENTNGSFKLEDGYMTVSVEPTESGKYQASFRGAKSSPHLQGIQGAVDWADAYRQESVRTQEIKSEPKVADGERRAISGGQEGVNGYFYKGGQFLPTTMAEPGKWKVNGKWVASGKELIEPGVFANQPTPFSRSILSFIRDWVEINNGEMKKIGREIRDYSGSPVTLETMIRPGVKGVLGKEELSLGELIEAYNNGQRWFDVKPDAQTVTTIQSEPNPLTQTDSEESSLKKREAKSASKSADAGEELTYNKRNRRKDGIKWDEIADKNDALKAKEVVKAKVYPKPDYEALIAGGMKPVIAHMVKQMYDGIASAPKLGRGEVLSDASMKAYIDGVNRVMDGVMAWANDSQAIASWAGRQSRMAGQSFSVMDTFSKNDTPLTFVYPNGWKERQAEVHYLGGNKFYGALQPGYDEVARFLKDQKMGWPAKADLWKKQGYKIIEATGLEVDSRVANRRDGSTSVFAYLSSKGAGRSNAIESLVFDGAKSVEDADVKAAIDQRLSELEGKYVLQDKVGRFVGAFDSMEEAEQGAKDATKREQDSGKVKEIGRVVTEVERIGADRRMEGQNVTAQDLLNTFGFRGINFGNSMQGDSKSLVNERQLHLNHIYDAFLDLAEILNVPPKAMSLNGMLGIAVGAQGSGKALAHFVPGVNEINITRRAGAGALAHEWGHALDHYFANMAGASTKQRPYMTELVSGPKKETVRVDGQWVTRPISTQNVRQEVVDQFRAVVEAMKKRPETEEERKKRLEDGKEKAMSGIKQWMDYFRREVSKVNGVDNSEYIKALDVAEGRINNMDFGDGVIAVSKNTEVHPVVADIKNAVEKATGVAPKTDHLNAISIYIDRAKAFDGVLKSTESHDPQIVDTNYLKTSKAADGKKQQGYWSSTIEMFARALDAYVVDSLKERGNKNEYLSGIEAVAPAGEERKTINKAFDFLFAELKSKETDNGIALYSDSANHAENGEYRTFDDYYKAQASAFNGRPEVERTASVSTDVRADNGIDSIRRRTGSVLANGISADFRDRSATKLTGKVIHTPEDLAVAAQVYRNPKFETARYFFLKDGVVVGQTAVSSRKPGVTKALVGDTMFDQVEHIDDIADQASSLGADSIWLLHNHPDGKPIPSEPDVRATNTLAGAFESRGFKVPYHVIINNKSYGVLNVGEKSITGSVEVFDFGADAQYSIDNPKVSHALLGSMIYSPTDLALNAKKAQVSAGQVVIIGLSGGNGIRTISEVTPAQLRGKFGAAILRRIARQTGSDRLFAYGVAPSDMPAVQAAIKSGLLADAIVVEDGIEMSVIGMSPSLKKRDGYSLGTKDSGVTVEMTAWHGSPHDHDKFDISKIGTGEGAQAYGYGLYFAGGKEVAEWYRNKLSGYSPHNLVLNGEKYNGLSNREMMAFAEAVQKADGLSDKATEILAVLLMKHKGDLPKATDEIGSRTIVPENEPDPDKEWFELEDWAMKGTEQYNQTNGKLYQVELAPSEDEYLDWDKPLSEQSKIIQKSIKDVASEYDDIGFGSDLRQSISDNEKGESFYRLLTRVSGSDKNASRDLERNGARGIRYLDGNSRGAGDGNHNYVIFNDADVSITAKYAKDAKRTDVSPAQIRESLINQFGDAGVRALEKNGMLKIMRLEDAPAEIRKEAEEQGASALYTADGVAYLFSDRMSAEEAPGKLLHEIGEHHGLESMLGSDGWGRMKKRVVAMAKAKGSVANGAWEGVKANYGEFAGMSDEQLAGNDRFLHEVLASIGENKAGLKTSLWRELVAQVKEWLSSKGFFTESITEGDIANLVSGSLKKVMRQAQSGLVGQATMTDIAYDYFKDIVSAMKSNKLLIEDCA